MATDRRDTRKRTKTSITPAQLLELGKLPPQAVDLEEAVLGALMLDKAALASVIDILKPETFYREAHFIIFKAIHTLFHDSQPVDILTVTQQLKKTDELEIAGGAFYVTQLTNRIASAANVEVHARIIIEKYLQRELIRVSTTTLQNSYEDSSDVFKLLEDAEKLLFEVSQTNIKKNYEHIRSLIGKAIHQIENSKDQKFQGVPSGYTRFDAITGGWQNSDLIILAARPAMGKTGLAACVARNAAVDFNKPIAIFSLEMTALQLTNRLISAEVEFTSEKLRTGDLNENDYKQLNEKIIKLVNAPIYIDDTPAISIFDFRAKAKRLKAEHNIALIIVDYLQLMTTGGESKRFVNAEQEVSQISSNLKRVAKELNVPIIALSQLSRAVEGRDKASKKPQLSDLRGSGSIEQDADLVLFLYRPEYYGIDVDENGNSTQGMAEVIIAKHRNGRVGSENLIFIPQFTKFVQPSETFDFMNEKKEEPASYGAKSGGNQSIDEDF